MGIHEMHIYNQFHGGFLAFSANSKLKKLIMGNATAQKSMDLSPHLPILDYISSITSYYFFQCTSINPR